MDETPLARFARPLRQAIVGEVRAIFNDQARGQKPVARSDDSLFGPGSVIWRVHGDVTTMMVGGVAALLMQMLHPAVLAGVWDHSDFREDMLGRLRRTARFIAITTYASRTEAEAAIQRVRAIHDHVAGVLPGGRAYRAGDPRLLAWVHVTEARCFLDAWIRYAEPDMSMIDQDRYFAEFARIGRAMGADPVPRTRREAEELINAMRGQLRVDQRTREVAGILLRQQPRSMATAPAQAISFRAAVDLLPEWARRMHELPTRPLVRPLIRAGTWGMAGLLRWAFRRPVRPMRTGG
ncbi:oxygenase MpaB family protein [Sphingomonas quercus]|uniref:DUF2236 domain-containing protein n=1 Tax=Sphingomonas quercus TaxID=2842451 RepID=A0ABS6BPL9_9SPHN|nr:oxygenase MpaB family protein [Sphingomonas quercus]MBU3079356.1 DUF2236 domain-containing protein [Sphingomonas quercus]